MFKRQVVVCYGGGLVSTLSARLIDFGNSIEVDEVHAEANLGRSSGLGSSSTVPGTRGYIVNKQVFDSFFKRDLPLSEKIERAKFMDVFSLSMVFQYTCQWLVTPNHGKPMTEALLDMLLSGSQLAH